MARRPLSGRLAALARQLDDHVELDVPLGSTVVRLNKPADDVILIEKSSEFKNRELGSLLGRL